MPWVLDEELGTNERRATGDSQQSGDATHRTKRKRTNPVHTCHPVCALQSSANRDEKIHSELAVLGRTAFGSPNSIYLSNPKNGHQTNRTISWHHLAHLAESSGVTKLELFKLFPHCKWGFSRCTDSARLRQDFATKDIKIGIKLT